MNRTIIFLLAGLIISSIAVLAIHEKGHSATTSVKTIKSTQKGLVSFSKPPKDDTISRYYLTPGPGLRPFATKSSRYFPQSAQPHFAAKSVPNIPNRQAPLQSPSPTISRRLSAQGGFTSSRKTPTAG